MNKIILTEPQQLKSIQEIFDEAKVGQAFRVEYEGDTSIAIKVKNDGAEKSHLIDLLDGYEFSEVEYITSLKPIDVEIRKI